MKSKTVQAVNSQLAKISGSKTSFYKKVYDVRKCTCSKLINVLKIKISQFSEILEKKIVRYLFLH